MIGYKRSLNNFNKTGTTQGIFSHHNELRLEIANRTKSRKFTNMWKFNKSLN